MHLFHVRFNLVVYSLRHNRVTFGVGVNGVAHQTGVGDDAFQDIRNQQCFLLPGQILKAVKVRVV